MNEPILMLIGTSGPRGKGMKRSILEVRRSNVSVTRGQRYTWRHYCSLDPLGSGRFSSLQTAITNLGFRHDSIIAYVIPANCTTHNVLSNEDRVLIKLLRVQKNTVLKING